jgi:hypothetical protein
MTFEPPMMSERGAIFFLGMVSGAVLMMILFVLLGLGA